MLFVYDWKKGYGQDRGYGQDKSDIQSCISPGVFCSVVVFSPFIDEYLPSPSYVWKKSMQMNLRHMYNGGVRTGQNILTCTLLYLDCD